MKESETISPEFINMKMSETIGAIIRDMMVALNDFTNMNDAKAFVKKYLSKEVDLSQFSKDHKTLFHKLVELASTEFALIAKEKKGIATDRLFNFVGEQTKIPHLKEKLFTVVAFPHIKKFIQLYVA